MSDEDAESTKRSTSSDSEESQPRPRKKTSGEQSSQKRSTASSAKSSSGSRSSQSSTARSSTSSSRTSGSKSSSGSSSDASGSEAGESERSRRSSLSAVSASKKAIQQFGTLTGREPESVVGVRKNDDGWNVKLEVVEARRVPDTADLLAEYDIDLDAAGELLSYDRTTRYVRGRPSA